MPELGAFILAHTQWLYTRVYENAWFFFDLWSFHHFWSGLVLFALLRRLGIRRPWQTLAAILVGYELVELLFIYVAFGAFRPETLKDQGTDLVVGMTGGALGRLLAGAASTPHLARVKRGFTTFFTAASVAFLWVGSYGYEYNQPALNSPGLNWWAFLLWSATIVVVLLTFTRLEATLGARARALGATWLLYLGALAVGEAVGYVVLDIHEVGHPGARALGFDLVHGTPLLHAFYLTAPLTSVLVRELAAWLFRVDAPRLETTRAVVADTEIAGAPAADRT